MNIIAKINMLIKEPTQMIKTTISVQQISQIFASKSTIMAELVSADSRISRKD